MEKEKKILVVDDDAPSLYFLHAVLHDEYDVSRATNGQEAIEYAKSIQPDLMILDMHMPDKNGIEIAEYLNEELQLDIPIIFVSASNEKELITKAIGTGAYDYIIKPFSPKIIEEKVKKTLQRTAYIEFKRTYKKAIHIMESLFAKGIEGFVMEDLQDCLKELITIIKESKFTIGKIVSLFQIDYTEASHNVNVSVLSICLGKQLNMRNSQLLDLATAAVLHDIGKLTINKEILNKSTSLTSEEEKMVQLHTKHSVELAKKMGIKKIEILQAIASHHEKLDGTGYPEHLIGSQIPLYAQILCVCDIFDALTTERTFREKYSSFDALMMMKKNMPSQINEKLVNSLIQLLR